MSWQMGRALAAMTALWMIVAWLPVRAQDATGPDAQSADEFAAEGDGGADPDAPEGVIPTLDVFQVMRKGGILMWPILLCSVIVLVFVFERMICLRRSRVIPGPFVKRFFHQLREGQLDREESLALCQDNDSPVARVFAGALQKWGRPSVEVEQALIDSGERASTDLRRYLRVFNSVSTVSPLLGLLGTVLGMIKAFNAVATSNALGQAEKLANGIAEALLTTAAGLTVAIPALIAYWVFVSQSDRLLIEMDGLGQELVNLISADGAAIDAAQARANRSRKRETVAQKQPN
jgi:biopolymer transport protein ExbB